MNRKVKNARKCIYDGIVFKSKSEMEVYIFLKDRNLNPRYEPEKVVLQQGFKLSKPWFKLGILKKTKVQDMTYTPDFVFDYNGYKVYLEVKGWETDAFPLHRKMFLKVIEDQPKSLFAQVKNVEQLVGTFRQLEKL